MPTNLAVAYPDTYLSIAKYQDLERETEIRHEYYDGKVVAMAGGTGSHSILCANISHQLFYQLKRKRSKCMTLTSEMKLSVEETSSYLYPDAMVVCGPIEWASSDPHAVSNPILIVEVLSPSSRYRDQVNKFNLYKTLPSFREYVLIDQNQPRVEVYYKNPKTQIWSKTVAEGLQSKMNLQSLNIAISLRDLYQQVNF